VKAGSTASPFRQNHLANSCENLWSKSQVQDAFTKPYLQLKPALAAPFSPSPPSKRPPSTWLRAAWCRAAAAWPLALTTWCGSSNGGGGITHCHIISGDSTGGAKTSHGLDTLQRPLATIPTKARRPGAVAHMSAVSASFRSSHAPRPQFDVAHAQRVLSVNAPDVARICFVKHSRSHGAMDLKL